jgi:hypothetical protein
MSKKTLPILLLQQLANQKVMVDTFGASSEISDKDKPIPSFKGISIILEIFQGFINLLHFLIKYTSNYSSLLQR